MEIRTKRLLLRRFEAADWKDLQEIVIDKEASEYAIYDFQFPCSEKDVKEITGWFAKGSSFLAVWELSANKVIGYVSLNGDQEHEKDLGYCLHSAYHGKGYATEACSSLINYAFNNLPINKLTSGTAILNDPSCKLLERLGFHKVGEGVASFRKTPEGTPIEFTGASFVLERENWLKTEYYRE